MPLRQYALCAVGQVVDKLLALPAGVQQEGSAGLYLAYDVVNVHIALLVAGCEIGHGNVVGAADRLMAEAQMAAGHAAGFLGVVLEIRLNVLIGVVADYLDGVLVGAHGAVGAQAPELAGDDGLAGGDDVLSHGQ